MPVLSTADNPTPPAAIPGGQALRSRAASHGAAPFPSLSGRGRTAPTRSPAGRSGEGGPRMRGNDDAVTLAPPVSGRGNATRSVSPSARTRGRASGVLAARAARRRSLRETVACVVERLQVRRHDRRPWRRPADGRRLFGVQMGTTTVAPVVLEPVTEAVVERGHVTTRGTDEKVVLITGARTRR